MPKRRESVNRTGQVVKVASGLFLLASALLIWHQTPAPVAAPVTPREFFSDDDGATWFADDGGKIAPFAHNGKTAVLAKVYECKDKTRFVGYLIKFTDEGKIHVTAKMALRTSPGPTSASTAVADELLVKKPGAADWVANTDPRAKGVRTVVCPDGSLDLVGVKP